MFNNYDDYVAPEPKATIYNPYEGKNLSQRKCPTCGATDIVFNPRSVKLMCKFCKKEFGNDLHGDLSTNHEIHKLSGRIVSLGAANIETCDTLITLRCTSCGAEVTIDQSKSHQTKCHWCRNTLSINNQIPNGTIPDIIVPFTMSRDEAYTLMKNFLADKKTYAKRGFKKAFKKNAIIGVYFPYMVVDLNNHISFKGEGEQSVVRYEKDIRKATEVYNAKLYSIERNYDLYIDNLIIEANLDKLVRHGTNTNNIINSILPYDISTAVPWDANYVQDYNIEKRDANIQDIEPSVRSQIKDIARRHNLESIKCYKRGVRWDSENIDIVGDFWQAAYLPVWLFTYLDKKDPNKPLHYIAINAQTKETMGSVPFAKNKFKFVHFSQLTLMILLILGSLVTEYLYVVTPILPIFFIIWSISYFTTKEKYRNSYARHKHEEETTYTTANETQNDTFIKDLRNLPSSTMEGCNHENLSL